jgi:hypothetical protein
MYNSYYLRIQTDPNPDMIDIIHAFFNISKGNLQFQSFFLFTCFIKVIFERMAEGQYPKRFSEQFGRGLSLRRGTATDWARLPNSFIDFFSISTHPGAQCSGLKASALKPSFLNKEGKSGPKCDDVDEFSAARREGRDSPPLWSGRSRF